MGVKVREKEEFKGKYWKHRWEAYLKYVVQYVREIDPEKILEIGTNGITLCEGSDTMDIQGNPTYLHDATKPFPIKGKQYDLVIATQVWEHLGTGQVEAFKEVMRVSHAAILSFPYLWKTSSDELHAGITKEIIDNWTNEEEYYDEKVVPNRNFRNKRLIRVYRW